MSSVILTLDQVEDLSLRMLTSSGATSSQAGPTARSIRDAEADGIRTVGLSYLPTYCDHLKVAKVVGDAVPTVEQPRAATVVVDAKFGFAHPAFETGRLPLVDATRTCGVAVLAVKHSYSAGVLGWFVERLADDGLVAIMFANSSALMAPAGGSQPFFGTNPIAWAAPRAGRPPVVADLSSSAVAWVRVNAAAQAGEEIPLGWALDADGNPTTNAAAALSGSMAPAAGHKGSALALLVDIMAGGVAGSSFSFEASGFGGNAGGPPDVGQVILAIDPTATMGSHFIERIEVELAAMTAQAGVRLPGDRRLASRADAARHGVEVPGDLMALLEDYAANGSQAVADSSVVSPVGTDEMTRQPS
ncbi:MAG: Ldh family oxidoreductase [Ilumatobacteraceae bacterium]